MIQKITKYSQDKNMKKIIYNEKVTCETSHTPNKKIILQALSSAPYITKKNTQAGHFITGPFASYISFIDRPKASQVLERKDFSQDLSPLI